MSDDLLHSDSTNSISIKRKNKAAADDVEIQNDVPSETPLKSSKSQAKTLNGDGLGNEETSSQDLKTSKKKKHKREEALDVPAPEEATPEPKEAKEKKKSKEGENADALQPPPAAAAKEEEAFILVDTNQKKKSE